jgi:outer membrane protein
MFGTSKINVINPRQARFWLAGAVSLGLSAACTLSALAQGAPAPAAAPGPVKIGIVNIQDAIFETNEGKKETDALQTKFTPKQTELKTLSDEVENLKKQYEAQQPKLSPEANATQARTIEAKQKSFQRNLEDAQNEFQQAQQDVINRIGTKMLTVLEKYAKDNGYSIILDVSNPQTPVIWASQGTVITKELVDAYNTANPAVAPAPKATGAGAAARPAAPRPAASPAATPKKP